MEDDNNKNNNAFGCGIKDKPSQTEMFIKEQDDIVTISLKLCVLHQMYKQLLYL